MPRVAVMGSGSGQARGEGMGALQRKRSDFRAPCTVHGSAAGTSAPRVFRDNTCLYWIKQIDQQSKQHETTPNARSTNEVLWISPSAVHQARVLSLTSNDYQKIALTKAR